MIFGGRTLFGPTTAAASQKRRDEWRVMRRHFNDPMTRWQNGPIQENAVTSDEWRVMSGQFNHPGTAARVPIPQPLTPYPVSRIPSPHPPPLLQLLHHYGGHERDTPND